MNMPDRIWVKCNLNATVQKLPEKYFPDPQTTYVRHDLAQSLADALWSCLDYMERLRSSGDAGNWEDGDVYSKAREALANYGEQK